MCQSNWLATMFRCTHYVHMAKSLIWDHMRYLNNTLQLGGRVT